MRKFGRVLGICLVVFTLAGCDTIYRNVDVSVEQEIEENIINIGDMIEIPGGKIIIEKIELGPIIEPLKPSIVNLYYECKAPGREFLNIRYTYVSEQEKKIEDIFKVTVTSKTRKYGNSTMIILKNDESSLSLPDSVGGIRSNREPESIKANSKERLFCVLEIESTDSEFKIEFDVNDEKYILLYDRSMGDFNAIGLNKEDNIILEDYAEIKVLDFFYTDELKRDSATETIGKSYKLQDESKVFATIKLEIRNLQDETKDIEKFYRVDVIYNKEKYKGLSVGEHEGTYNISGRADIVPQGSIIAYGIVEVPVEAKGNCTLKLYIDGKDYYYDMP